MPEHLWDSNDSLCFSIPPAEQDLDVAVTLGVRTTPSFRYKDIVARAELLDGDSVISSTPMNITLYNGGGEETAKGMIVKENYSKPQSFHMRANHHYTLRVSHLMRLNPLDEVQSVGIIVER
jgi:gliding motility-associated lipoprotein GldH